MEKLLKLLLKAGLLLGIESGMCLIWTIFGVYMLKMSQTFAGLMCLGLSYLRFCYTMNYFNEIRNIIKEIKKDGGDRGDV
jgi:hypothetical protein